MTTVGTPITEIYESESGDFNVYDPSRVAKHLQSWDPDLDDGSCYIPVSSATVYNEIMSKTLPQAYCTNCVSTFDFGVPNVNLRKIKDTFLNVRVDPRTFSAAIAKIVNPSATLLLFQSGSVVCTGPKSPLLSMEAVFAMFCLLKKFQFPAEIRKFTIQNMVFVAMVPYGIDIARIAVDYSCYVNYEPNLFPGLVFRLTDIRRTTASDVPCATKMVINMFCSGKLVMTGAKSVHEAMQVYRWVCRHIIFDKYTLQVSMNSSTYAAINDAAIPSNKLQQFLRVVTSDSCALYDDWQHMFVSVSNEPCKRSSDTSMSIFPYAPVTPAAAASGYRLPLWLDVWNSIDERRSCVANATSTLPRAQVAPGVLGSCKRGRKRKLAVHSSKKKH